MPDPRIDEATTLMNNFALRTGLTSSLPQRRYLWTDAFAICNYLGLARSTGDERYMELALQLVNEVHHTLGRHRDDDKRTGWISGLGEEDGELHPTRGGLRIGKALPERGPDEAVDENREWDRDGQYYHYLTKWMHALDQVTRATKKAIYNTWSRELAHRAFNAFTFVPSSGWQPRRMVWKMSIDLTYALVPSMGQHDPLDGYITNLQLLTTTANLAQPASAPDLADDTSKLAPMLKWGDWTTTDPLGIGGLLTDACRLHQLMQQGLSQDMKMLDDLLSASLSGLEHYAGGNELQQPAQSRLAFRELGLSIGLHAVERLQKAVDDETDDATNAPLNTRLDALMQYIPLRDHIETFWRDPEHQRSRTWTGHRDINEVMLATSLAPEGYLELVPL